MAVPQGLHLVRLLVATVLVGVAPFLDLRELKRLREGKEGWRRLRYYRSAVLGLWVAGIICFALIGFHGLLRLPQAVLAATGIFSQTGTKMIVRGCLAGLLIGLMLPGMLCLFSKHLRSTYTKAYAKNELSYLFPVGLEQRRWWLALSLAAGVCEELIFRGFLLTVARVDLGLGLATALLITSLAFGWAHLYQGLAGILKTGLVGLVLAAIAWLSGGLLLPMLLHTWIDAQVLVVYRPELLEGQ
jgi:membrane protease YdiL (CAAX protease family)